MTKRLILALLFSSSPLWATTYYVDNCVTVGNDRNNGTSTSTPWLTINKVNTSKFNPGDSILFESTCTWREQLTVPSSGSAGSPITFGAYGTGAAPIISGANVAPSGSWISDAPAYYQTGFTQPNQVFENGTRYSLVASKAALGVGTWWWDAVNSRVYVRTSGDNAPSGYTITVSQRNYAIYNSGNNYVTISGLHLTQANLHGLETETSTGVNLTGLLSDYNYEKGIGEYRASGTEVVNLTSSTLSYNGASGFQPSSIANSTISYVSAFGNCAVDLSGDPWQWCAGIRTDVSAMTGVVVEYCNVYNNGATRSTNKEVAGIWFDTVPNAGNIIRYNIVYNNFKYGIFLEANVGTQVYYNVVYGHTGSFGGGSYGRGLLAGRGSQSNLIYNNTIYNNAIGLAAEGDSGVSGLYTNNLFKNNLSVGNTVYQLEADGGASNDGTYGSGNVYTYNGFGPAASGFILWDPSGVTTYSTYATWEAATGNCGTPGCSHSIQSAPTFANASAGQFWLTSGSPGIDAGVNLGSPYNIGLLSASTWPNSVVTGDQNAYGSGWEMGAFVYVPPLALNPPSNLQAVVR